MVTLKWGDVLSMLLPGSVALLAVSRYFPLLESHIANISQATLGSGVALLLAAALAGGILEGLTRITWEKLYLVKRCPLPKGILEKLKPDNIELYERSVQGSYKWATFYANFAFATCMLIVSRALNGQFYSTANLILLISMAILLTASYVQWTYFVNYQTKVFGGTPNHVEERTTTGDQSQIHEDGA
jgi:hypothetical protein